MKFTNYIEIREQIQEKAYQEWLNGDKKGIIKVAPRAGKTFIACKAIPDYDLTVIVIPRIDIKEGWKDTFKIKNIDTSKIIFVTTRALKNIRGLSNLLLILDEIHEYSENQLLELEVIVSDLKVDVMALTGTLSIRKENRIIESIGITINYEYMIEKAVSDGILTDYEINIHKVPLNMFLKNYPYKGGVVSEKVYFDRISYAIKKMPQNKFFLEKKIISLLQVSSNKVKETFKLLDLYKDERVLVFCGQTKVADSLGIPVYHSKNQDKTILEQFCKDLGVNQLATVKMLQAGITIKPIDRGIIQYTSGSPEDCAQKICRFLAFEWNKKAKLDVICANEDFELDRIRTALMYFDKAKINYI